MVSETNNVKDIYGTPDAGDQIARIEKTVNDSVSGAVKTLEGVIDQIAPRPLGSQKVPQDEETFEYIATIAGSADPVAGALEWMQQRASMVGWPKARADFADYIRRNEKHMEKLAGGSNVGV